MLPRVWAKPSRWLSSATCRAGSPGSRGRGIHLSSSGSDDAIAQLPEHLIHPDYRTSSPKVSPAAGRKVAPCTRFTTAQALSIGEATRVRSTIYCRSRMQAPWGFTVAAHGNPSFHFVTRGTCRLEVDPEEP